MTENNKEQGAKKSKVIKYLILIILGVPYFLNIAVGWYYSYTIGSFKGGNDEDAYLGGLISGVLYLKSDKDEDNRTYARDLIDRTKKIKKINYNCHNFLYNDFYPWKRNKGISYDSEQRSLLQEFNKDNKYANRQMLIYNIKNDPEVYQNQKIIREIIKIAEEPCNFIATEKEILGHYQERLSTKEVKEILETRKSFSDTLSCTHPERWFTKDRKFVLIRVLDENDAVLFQTLVLRQDIHTTMWIRAKLLLADLLWPIMFLGLNTYKILGLD